MLFKNLINLTFEQLQKYKFSELEFIDTFQIVPTKNKVYNIEFFTNQYEFLSAVQLSNIEFEQDYLGIVKNKISAPNIVSSQGGYIKITSDDFEKIGIITQSETEKNVTTVSYKDFIDITNIEINIDKAQLSTKTIEQFIADYITNNYVSNSDALQNIDGLEVVCETYTSGNNFEITENVENFYQKIIYDAFLKYGIVVSFEMNVKQEKIICRIRKNLQPQIVIESHLPNIIKKTIEIGTKKESLNKLIVLNEDDLSESKAYFLHTDMSVSDVDEDRISPVVFKTETVKVTSPDTFASASLEKAIEVLKPLEYNNLIELEVANFDALINPYAMQIGQKVSIIDNENTYESILTGKKIGKTTTLIFGTIRKELTKKLKRRL